MLRRKMGCAFFGNSFVQVVLNQDKEDPVMAS
jgi:hypothetical protein